MLFLTTRDIHAKFLLKNGADEVIYPNRDSAEKLAVRVSNDNLYDYVELIMNILFMKFLHYVNG